MVSLRRSRTATRAASRNTPSQIEHRYQPFANTPTPGSTPTSRAMARPPKLPQKPKARQSNFDSRDDVAVSRKNISRRDQDDNGGYTSDGSVNTLSGRPYRNNDPITVVTVSLKQALKLQKTKLGEEHPSVTRVLHSLALEYKVQGKLSKSVRLLNEGIEILDSRLSRLISQSENEPEDDDSRCSTETRVTEMNASDARKAEIIMLLEEKSTLYSCLGNIYRTRRLYKEAIDHYVKSCDMLVEAGYSGESKRINMMIRIMRRTEVARTKKPPVRVNMPTIQRISLEALR